MSFQQIPPLSKRCCSPVAIVIADTAPYFRLVFGLLLPWDLHLSLSLSLSLLFSLYLPVHLYLCTIFCILFFSDLLNFHFFDHETASSSSAELGHHWGQYSASQPGSMCTSQLTPSKCSYIVNELLQETKSNYVWFIKLDQYPVFWTRGSSAKCPKSCCYDIGAAFRNL